MVVVFNMQLVQDGYQMQVEVVATLLIPFGAHMNISFIIKVKIFMLIT
jgi:hypothetical protein